MREFAPFKECEMKSYCEYQTSIAHIRIQLNENKVVKIELKRLPAIFQEAYTFPPLENQKKLDVTECEAAKQIIEYIEGNRKNFTFQHELKATPFTQTVLKAITQIPYGQTASYGEIAQAIGKPKAARAVGGALNRNPLLLLYPCHRVLGANKKLTGFAAGIEAKQALLDLESKRH